MVPKFANPHSLSQDVELITRSEIAERAGLIPIVHDEDNLPLKRELDSLLQDTWGVPLVVKPSSFGALESRNTHDNEGDQLTFRLLSSMKRPQHISLDPKPMPQPVSKAPDAEDDKMQAETRRIRSLAVAVEPDSLGRDAVLMRRIDRKGVTAEAKVPSTVHPGPLPPFLVTEEARASRNVPRGWRVNESFAASPHEHRPSCTVLSVISVPNQREMPVKKRRKQLRERPPPAYWRPSSEQRGKCMGYALGYPSSWAPDRRYVRDVMKRGIEWSSKCHAVPDGAQ